jgi:hypothetical protein
MRPSTILAEMLTQHGLSLCAEPLRLADALAKDARLPDWQQEHLILVAELGLPKTLLQAHGETALAPADWAAYRIQLTKGTPLDARQADNALEVWLQALYEHLNAAPAPGASTAQAANPAEREAPLALKAIQGVWVEFKADWHAYVQQLRTHGWLYRIFMVYALIFIILISMMMGFLLGFMIGNMLGFFLKGDMFFWFRLFGIAFALVSLILSTLNFFSHMRHRVDSLLS